MKNLTYYKDFSIPIDHDTGKTNIVGENASGEFNLIAGAGNLTLQIRQALGEGAFILKNLTFNGPKDSELEPISDDDAMRRNGSNYERILNITIDPTNLTGHVYDDIDDNGLFNESIDEPLSDATVTLLKVTAIYQDEDRIELDTLNPKSFVTNETGQYQISGLLPGIYRLIVTKDGYNLHLTDVTIHHEVINNTYDAPNAKLSALEGVVFIDVDGNDEYDSGEELLEDVDVELLYEGESVGTYKTDETGYYSFDSLIPGLIDNLELNEYVIKAVKVPYYEAEATVYPVENETTIFNISMGLTPVTVSGVVTYEGTPVEEADIYFELDGSVDDNTAADNETTTESDGTYEIKLSPGSYNITVTKYEGDTLVYVLVDQKLNLSLGQGTKSEDFSVDKTSVTVTGETTYRGNNIANVSISFETDVPAVDFISTSIISDENGIYSIELPPGNYTVEAESEEFSEGDKNYTYKFTGTMTIMEAEIAFGKTFDIVLVKTETE
jgi:hypothetical protein